MFREMRRKRQALSGELCEEILKNGSCGTLALSGDNGYPYAVPMSYVFDGDKIYFHCAREGHKLDCINRCDKASFCVIGADRVVPLEYTTYFSSVIVFGRLRTVEDDGEKRRAINKLSLKYAPSDSEENRAAAIEKDFKPLCILELTIEHMSGKEAIELTKACENI